MAVLSSQTTDKQLSFTKYVTNNKRLKDIDFEIDKGLEAVLYTKSGITYAVSDAPNLKPGEKFKITDTKLYDPMKLKLAKVAYKNRTYFAQISKIRKPTGGNGTQYEDEVVDSLNSYIKDAGGVVTFVLKGDNRLYRDMRYAVKVDSRIKSSGGVKGDPKADIIICADIKNPTAKGSIYISHKKEGGPEAFQQYGGLSKQAGEHIFNHPLTQKFLKAAAGNITGDKLTSPLMMTFDDKELSNLSIYGPEYGKAFSLQNTQLIGQGSPRYDYSASKDITTLDFSSHMSLNGDLSHFVGGYEPVFGATYRAGRGFDFEGKRYSGARVALYPKNLMQTRSKLITFKG